MTPPPEPKLKLKNRLLPLLVGLLLVLTLIFPHESWLMMLVGLGLLWLICYLWAWALTMGLSLERDMRFGWAQVGDRLEERFTLTNSSGVPALWVEVNDHSTLPDHHISQVRSVGSLAQTRWKAQGVCTQRGIFTLGPTTLRSGDPFGLYEVTLHHPACVTLTVTPPIVPLPTIEVAPGGRAGEGRPNPHAMEQTINTDGVRDYVPGDSLRYIHWPTSARQGELYVHQFQNTPAGDWWLILDLEAKAQVGQGQNSTEEHGVIMAASLADKGLRDGRGVGLLAYGEELVWLRPDRGDTQRQKILQALATAHPGEQSLAALLAQISLGRLASLILITPSTDSRWLEALTPLLRRGAVATVLLLDPIAFGDHRDSTPLQSLLTDLNIATYPLTPDLLDRPESRPGHQGQWAWRVSPLGKAIATQKPREMAWRKLGGA